MLSRIKNLMVVLVLICVMVLCVFGIIYINQITNNQYTAISLDTAEEVVYSSYSSYIPGRMDLRVGVEVSGEIVSSQENLSEELSFTGAADDVKVSQGDTFTSGDLLFDNGSTSYYAKFSGVMDRVTVSDTKVNMTLINYDGLYVSASIPEEYVRYIDTGDYIVILYNDQEIEGTVSYVSGYMIEGTALVEISFSDEDLSLRPYATVELYIVQEEATDVIAVPENALIQSGDEYYLRIKTNDDNELVSVTVGMTSSDGYVEIKDGISEDDVILIDNTTSSEDDTEYEE